MWQFGIGAIGGIPYPNPTPESDLPSSAYLRSPRIRRIGRTIFYAVLLSAQR